MGKRAFIAGVAALLVALLVPASRVQAVNWDISCQGRESAGGGQRLYQYELLNVSGQQLTLTDLYVGSDDGALANYSNWLEPANWNHNIIVGGGWANPGLKTPHGLIAPPPQGFAAWWVHWSAQPGAGVVVPPLGTVLLGFDNPHESENVDWYATPEVGPGIGANWAAPVAGPAGIFTHGPVHGPVPEPACAGLLILGFWAVARRRRSQR